MPKLHELRVVLTESAARIRLNDAGVDPQYLALSLNSAPGQKQVAELVGTGGGVPKLALVRIRTIQVAVPSEDEQRRVVKVLGALHAQVKLLQREISKSEGHPRISPCFAHAPTWNPSEINPLRWFASLTAFSEQRGWFSSLTNAGSFGK